jgi:hypothetical protein
MLTKVCNECLKIQFHEICTVYFRQVLIACALILYSF